MRKQVMIALLLFVAAMMVSACGGGGGGTTPNPPTPADFDRMTATVTDSSGEPVEGLAVRVDGTATGVATNTAGQFELTAANFPGGVDRAHEISLGRNGVVLGADEFVPSQNRTLNLRFGQNFGLPDDGGNPVPTGDPGRLEGNIFDETTEEMLSGVEVMLSSPSGFVQFTTTDGGHYAFEEVPSGNCRLTAYLPGYKQGAASVEVNADETTVKHLALVPRGSIDPGDGLVISGTLLDSDTGAPISGAELSMYVDTGYYGMPVPELMDDMDEWADSATGWAEAAPGMPREGSMMWEYDPQFQNTTTAADGSFEFPQPVAGYSIYLDYYASGYLNGTHYEMIDGRTGTLNLNLELEPFVATSVTGTVVDDLGEPVAGAYVEFIWQGDWGGTLYEDGMDLAMPAMPADEMFENGMDNRSDNNVPPPGAPMPDSSGQGDWDDFADIGAGAPGSEGANSAPGASGVDNQMMQRFRWENQQGERTSSDAMFFGYYSASTDENGEFTLTDVPAGPYYVFSSAYRHLAYDGTCELLENSAENVLTITLPNVPVGAVEGYITDETGQPVPDTLVNCTQPNVDPFTYTDENGYYLIENVPAGDWIIGAYKSGYMTMQQETVITADATAQVDLAIYEYEPTPVDTIAYSGQVVDGIDNGGVGDADIVFTPVNNEYGGYYQHVTSSEGGSYAAALIPTEYNVLIQREGYQDLYIRIWVDATYPQMDFWLWPVDAAGGGGGWGGIGGPEPMPAIDMAMPERGPNH
jgi:protocatechuate 3,4-dioxygenase beta subunit